MMARQPLLALQVPTVQVFESTAALLAYWPHLQFENEDILVKGGRHFAFEQIAALLQAQQHQTVLEINLNALVRNLQVYRSKITPATKLMVMVKAFGYGSGDAEIAKTLQYNGVDYLSVAYADEGVALRQAGVTLPIMVLNADAADFDTLEKNDLEPEVFSFDMLDALLLWCQQRGVQHHPVHIKLDTGMHRLGLEPHEVGRLADVLAGQHWLVVKSVFTHLVASEDANADYFTAAQLQKFDAACTVLEASLGYTFLKHAANTAAISRHPQAHYHMVRLGVGIYGGAPGLMPVMQLFTTVAQVKKVKAGETVGYGLEARLLHDSVIATVRIGYADGYRRSLSNGVGRMLVRGQMAPVVGRVCMDMTMLDVTHIDGVMPGDTVEVMGANISLQQLAQWCQTITYEIMTGISQRVKRIYVQE
jgi:alanine racemase